MRRAWRIGSAFGIGLYLHWSFLLVPVLLGLYNLFHLGAAAGLLAFGAVLAVFGCVLLHELGHAQMARLFGINTRDITLYPIGGVARLERMTERPVEELLIALAGPFVNGVIAGGILVGMVLSGVRLTSVTIEFAALPELFLLLLLQANVALVLFNMLPAFPMDGGRVLRAVLSMFLSRLRATEIAVWVGAAFCLLFVIGGLYGLYEGFNPIMAVVGLFVFFIGQQELAVVRHRERARRMSGRPGTQTIESMPDFVPSTPPVEPGFSGFTWDRRSGVWVEWRDGRPVGAVSVGRSGPVW